MNQDPHMKRLADILVRVAVRELQTAHAGKKNARPTPIGRANYFRNEKDDTRKKTVITKID